jgi:hypothetical protein
VSLDIGFYVVGLFLCFTHGTAPFMIADLPNTKVQKGGKPKTLWDVLLPEQANEKKTHTHTHTHKTWEGKCPFMEKF